MRRRRGSNGIGWGSTLIFRNDLQNTLVPQSSIGSPTPTFIRATTASVSDFEGKVNTALSGESRFKGARRVENLITASEDISNVGTAAGQWGLTAATGDSTSFTPSSQFGKAQQLVSATAYASGDVVTARFDISSEGNTALHFNAEGSGAGVAFTCSSTTQTISITTTLTGAQLSFGVQDRNASGFGKINLTNCQIELVTGQSNQNPSEYVSSGVLSAPYHGANVDSVQYFNTLNANTVSSNVVTETTGALIGASNSYADANGPFGYMSEAAATNICLQNRDFTNAAWAAVNMTPLKDEVGIDGVANSASSLLSTAANGTILQTFTITSAVKDGSFWLKRLIGTGNVDITIDNGTTWTTKTLTTGWNKFDVTATLANPVIGIRIVTSGDKVAVDYAQLEASAFASSEIETTTVAVTRNADVLTYDDVSNVEDAAGTAYAEASTDWSSTLSETYVLARTSVGRLLYLPNGVAATKIQIYDGTASSASPTGTSMLNAPQSVASTWGSAQTAYFNGDPDLSPAAYDGTMGTGDIGIGNLNTGTNQWGGTIRNVKIYSNEKSDAEVLVLG